MHTDLGSWLAKCLSEGLKLSREPSPSEEPKRAEDGCEKLRVKPEHLEGLQCVRFEREAGDNVFLRFEHLTHLRRRAKNTHQGLNMSDLDTIKEMVNKLSKPEVRRALLDVAAQSPVRLQFADYDVTIVTPEHIDNLMGTLKARLRAVDATTGHLRRRAGHKRRSAD